jgi:hypothetical protein
MGNVSLGQTFWTEISTLSKRLGPLCSYIVITLLFVCGDLLNCLCSLY